MIKKATDLIKMWKDIWTIGIVLDLMMKFLMTFLEFLLVVLKFLLVELDFFSGGVVLNSVCAKKKVVGSSAA